MAASVAKLGRVSCLFAHQNDTQTRGAASPRSASPIGPAPTLLPRIVLPLLTESHLYALLAAVLTDRLTAMTAMEPLTRKREADSPDLLSFHHLFRRRAGEHGHSSVVDEPAERAHAYE